MSVEDWSTTPSNNLFLGPVNLQTGATAVGDVNNIAQQIMADVALWRAGMPVFSALQTKAAAVFSGTEPVYTGRGAYKHNATSGMASGQCFLLADGSPRPTGALPGAEIDYY